MPIPESRRAIDDGSGTVGTTFTLSITGPYAVFVPVAENWIVVVAAVAVKTNENGTNTWLFRAGLNGATKTWFKSDPAETAPTLLKPDKAAAAKESW